MNKNIEIYQQETIPIESGKLGLMVNSQDLYQKLQVNTRYNDWLTRRIKEYGFLEGVDFYSNLSKSQPSKYKGGRDKTVCMVTLDMAKEMAMVERNEFGRAVRRYFIEVEKQYRDWIGFVLPRLEKDVNLFEQRIGYNYIQLLAKVELSVKSGAVNSRKRRNPQEFWRNHHGVIFVSEDYGKNIIAYAAARKLSRETKQRRLDYECRKYLPF
jgi:phage anti-repressor protein